ncbi:MAG: GAF domain-containing protein [Candidatus Cloacimonetes bacterium]|nr:GAF domain-containing protein [Candidatus Cloacimonadota bacterium]
MTRTVDMEIVTALFDVSRAISSSLELSEILQRVMDLTTKVMRVEASSMVLLDEETGELIFYIAEGEMATKLKTFRMKSGEGVVGHVVQTKEAAIVNDVQQDERFFKKVDVKTGFVTKSILCVPLVSPTRVLGAIEVLNKLDGSDFDDLDKLFLESIAGQASIALENAMLHDSIVKNERMAAVGQAVAGLAHCIKNVLNGVQGGSYIIDMGLDKDNMAFVQKGWATVKKNNSFMQELVLDMLTYSKERKPEYEECDVNGTVAAVVELMQEKAKAVGVTMLWHPEPALGIVELDSKGIKRCVLNLISNAMDACGQKPDASVTVSTQLYGQHSFKILIKDTGTGIPPEAIPKLFQVFFSTKGSKGTGLGLAVTHKIIKEHGGRIDVTSKVGSGTTFTIVLPRKRKKNTGGK